MSVNPGIRVSPQNSLIKILERIQGRALRAAYPQLDRNGAMLTSGLEPLSVNLFKVVVS